MPIKSIASSGRSYDLHAKNIPKWLLDAEKENKERRKVLQNNKKRIAVTDDWRFWAALITTAGFVTAFVNIYQQTGGFGSSGADNVLII
jgi:hypothetical protein